MSKLEALEDLVIERLRGGGVTSCHFEDDSDYNGILEQLSILFTGEEDDAYEHPLLDDLINDDAAVTRIINSLDEDDDDCIVHLCSSNMRPT